MNSIIKKSRVLSLVFVAVKDLKAFMVSNENGVYVSVVKLDTQRKGPDFKSIKIDFDNFKVQIYLPIFSDEKIASAKDCQIKIYHKNKASLFALDDSDSWYESEVHKFNYYIDCLFNYKKPDELKDLRIRTLINDFQKVESEII